MERCGSTADHYGTLREHYGDLTEHYRTITENIDFDHHYTHTHNTHSVEFVRENPGEPTITN